MESQEKTERLDNVAKSSPTKGPPTAEHRKVKGENGAGLKFNREKKDQFLEVLQETSSITRACKIVGIDKKTAYEHKYANPEFFAEWEAALEIAVDKLLEEAWRRAHDGEPVTYQGKKIKGVTQKSDLLTMFLIKGRRQEYATERKEITGRNGGPLELRNVTEEELKRRLVALIESAASDPDLRGIIEAEARESVQLPLP